MKRRSSRGDRRPLDEHAWLAQVRATSARTDAGQAAVMLGVARALVAAQGLTLDPAELRLATLAGDDAALDVTPPPPEASLPDLAGRCYESILTGHQRRASGSHYTPASVAARLVAVALDGLPTASTVCDPACGGGAFLLAAARALHATGLPRTRVVEHLLWGLDIDPIALAVSELALALWSGTTPGDHLAVADALTSLDGGWAAAPAGGFGAVVGNPPFQSQLGRATARPGATRTALRSIYGDAVAPYADSAVLFLVAGARLARPGGRVVLVQPQSVLSSRDATGARRAVLTMATLEGLWVAGERVFSAATLVCAPVLRARRAGTGPTDGEGAGDAPSTVALWSGRDVVPRRPVVVDDLGLRRWPTWSPLAASAGGVPTVELEVGHGFVGDHATATAGFRQQFYGLAKVAVEQRDTDDSRFPRLVTCGLIDAGRCAWGERSTRFDGRSWVAPRVDVGALAARDGHGGEALARWVAARLVPKVLVATQTKVIEAAVDVDGTWLPSTPVISVEAAPGALWHLAAVLLAPPVSAWALRNYGSSALSADTIKLSARQVLEVPLPSRRSSWDAAAAELTLLATGACPRARRTRLLAVGAAMTAAYGCGEEVFDWWQARLPVER